MYPRISPICPMALQGPHASRTDQKFHGLTSEDSGRQCLCHLLCHHSTTRATSASLSVWFEAHVRCFDVLQEMESTEGAKP